MGVKSQFTQLYLRLQQTAGYSIVQIGCPTGITGLGGGRTQLDDTCLDSEEMEYLAGMAAPGPVTVNLNFDPAKISHKELWDLFESGDKAEWVIGWYDGKDIPPTVDSGSGTITFPTTRTYTSFEGYISDLPLDFAINSLVKSAMSIQRSGPRTMHYKA